MKSDSLHIDGLDMTALPLHIAVIMDGNGRWAQKKFLNRVKGHEKGSDTVRMVVRSCREIGISYLTLYAFSTENWQRPKAEVAALMILLKKFLVSERQEMVVNNIRFNVIGEQERLPEDVQKEIQRTKDATKSNNGMHLNLALSYGSRSEIVLATKQIAKEVQAGRLLPDAITEEIITAHLYTSDIPDPELLIRTSGEMRISNFLLWQIAYSEIAVTDTLWPDFTRNELIQILKEYQGRDRRFGRV
ncbi:MAG: isoprenyl transferase [Desulfobacteraceae bacterium]|nr:isoprenyl transferase [Desulfobacteraceae bacterium]